MDSLWMLTIARVHILDDFCMLPVVVTTANIGALEVLLINGASSMRYMPEDLEYARSVMCFVILRGLVIFLAGLRSLLTML